jgi:hypothetical protein
MPFNKENYIGNAPAKQREGLYVRNVETNLFGYGISSQIIKDIFDYGKTLRAYDYALNNPINNSDPLALLIYA